MKGSASWYSRRFCWLSMILTAACLFFSVGAHARLESRFERGPSPSNSNRWETCRDALLAVKDEVADAIEDFRRLIWQASFWNWQKSLTVDEVKAIQVYSVDGKIINKSLLGTTQDTAMAIVRASGFRFEALDSAINKGVGRFGLWLYRGIPTSQHGFYLLLKRGEEFSIKSYCSTTTKESIAWGWGSNRSNSEFYGSNVYLKILVPRGTPMAPLNLGDFQHVADVKEVVLARGLRFRVIDVEKLPFERTRITVEII